MKFLFAITFFLISINTFSQGKCNIVDNEWEKVEIKTYKKFRVKHLKREDICGESHFSKANKRDNNLGDLTADQIEVIKKAVLSWGCCVAYVDLKNRYHSTQGELFYVGAKK